MVVVKKYKNLYKENKNDVEKICGRLNEMFMYFKEEYNPCDCEMCFLYPFNCCNKSRWRDNYFSLYLFKGDSDFEIKQLSKIKNILTNKDKYDYLEKSFPLKEIILRLTRMSKELDIRIKIDTEELKKDRFDETVKILNLPENEKLKQKKLSNCKISNSGLILESAIKDFTKIKQIIIMLKNNKCSIFSFMMKILNYLDDISEIKTIKINTKKSSKRMFKAEYKKWLSIKKNISKIKSCIKDLDTTFNFFNYL